jgi:uncharacterized protein (TIGR02147 family)
MNSSPILLSTLLKEKLEERCQRNSNYSLRAFARDLGVAAPRVSRWLKGEEGLSENSARQISSRLNFNRLETESFVLAMQAQFARSAKDRKIASEKLGSSTSTYQVLNVDAFKVISDWYHLAVLSLFETVGFRLDYKWMAKRLGISIYEVKAATERMQVLEMIQDDKMKGLTPTGVFFANSAGIPSKSVRSFHSQILKKAADALEIQSTDERDFSALVLAVDTNDLPEAKIFIKNFRDQFEKKFCHSKAEKKEVYAFGIQFFKLTQPTNQTGETNEN